MSHAEPLLQLDGVSKRFGGLLAVESLTMDVMAGELHALIGPNGAGKSTALNLISGIYRPTAGRVQFRGRQIAGLRLSAITRLGVGRTFQNIRLVQGLSVVENVMVAGHVRAGYSLFSAIWRGKGFRDGEARLRQEAEQQLQFLGVTNWDARPSTLSYGQQKLVEIARALMLSPDLLLLDEPAAGLNPAETNSLAEKLHAIRQRGTALILIEHNIGFVMGLADRITVLEFGRKIAEGTPRAVRNDPQVIRAYLGGGEKASAV